MRRHNCLLPGSLGSDPQSGEWGGFSAKRFVLFMNRICEAMCQYGNRDAERKGHAMDVLVNHRELHIESKRVRASLNTILIREHQEREECNKNIPRSSYNTSS